MRTEVAADTSLSFASLHELTGLETLQELASEECGDGFKNQFELAAGLQLTASRLRVFFDDQIGQLRQA